jgi:hypothetical protein
MLTDSLPSTLSAYRRRRVQQILRAIATILSLALSLLPLFYLHALAYTLVDSFIPSICNLVGAPSANSCFAKTLQSQVVLIVRTYHQCFQLGNGVFLYRALLMMLPTSIKLTLSFRS